MSTMNGRREPEGFDGNEYDFTDYPRTEICACGNIEARDDMESCLDCLEWMCSTCYNASRHCVTCLASPPAPAAVKTSSSENL